MSDEPLPELLTLEEAAKYLRIHPDTLRRAAKLGEVKALRVGPRLLRFTHQALRDYLYR